MGLHLIESVEQQDGPQGTRDLWIEESILEHLRWQGYGQYPPHSSTLSPGHQARPPASDLEWPSLEIFSNLLI